MRKALVIGAPGLADELTSVGVEVKHCKGGDSERASGVGRCCLAGCARGLNVGRFAVGRVLGRLVLHARPLT